MREVEVGWGRARKGGQIATQTFTDTSTNDYPVLSVCCGPYTVLSPSPKLPYLIIIMVPKMAFINPFTRY